MKLLNTKTYCGLLIICVVFLGIMGCASRSSFMVAPDFKDRDIRLIAVMPIENKSGDSQAAVILRQELLESLYFKGYPKIPLAIVDEALSQKNLPAQDRKTESRAIADALKVDAALYCTLEKWTSTLILIYGSTSVAATFELRNAQTGEILWTNSRGVTESHYDITNSRLKGKSLISLEPMAREVVSEAMATLPDGPESVKSVPPSKKLDLFRWFKR